MIPVTISRRRGWSLVGRCTARRVDASLVFMGVVAGVGEYDTNFFELMRYIKDSEGCFDRYLGKKLLTETYKKEKISIESYEQIANYKKEIDCFKWEKFCAIVNLLYEFDDEDILLGHLINQVRKKAYDPDDSDVEEQNLEEDIFNATINILSYLRKQNITREEE